MPTTFNVIPLGQQTEIDQVEGDSTAENASVLVGSTFGSDADPLMFKVQEFAPAGAGSSGGLNPEYEMNNSAANDQFSIDGGAPQTFDALAVYNATLTYSDGTTANISAVIFQDTDGNTYLAPEMSENADQAALEAKPLVSLSLDSLIGGSSMNMSATRATGNYVTCFASGTLIRTLSGEVPVENLTVGDQVATLDNGPQVIRWIGSQTVEVKGPLTPIRITAGSLGKRVPRRDLIVSRQHRLLVQSQIAKRMFGTSQVLVSAAKLLHLKGVRELKSHKTVTYWHILCDNHEILFANGAPAESLYLGTQTLNALGKKARAEIAFLFPDLLHTSAPPSARLIPEVQKQRILVKESRRIAQPMVENGAIEMSDTIH
ncbi:MAG: Hint domain-containing protein [Pelagimonas sp.]|jgi:hypothetical protein|nr:Hint domain-containing protein [Pelagimonas sp.]